MRKKLSSISKKIKSIELSFKTKATLSIIVFLALLLTFISINRHYLIYSINLPKQLVEKGMSSNSLIENSISRMREVRSYFIENKSEKIFEYLTENNFNSLNCVNLDFESDLCNCRNELVKTISTEVGESKEFNVSVEGKGIKSDEIDLIELFRIIKGKPTIPISLSVLEKSKNRFVLKLNMVIDSVNSYSTELEVNNESELENGISILLMKYLYPSIYAEIMLGNDFLEAKSALDIAYTHYEEYEETAASNTLIGYMAMSNYIYSSDIKDLELAREKFIKALEVNGNYKNAKLGLIAANRTIIYKSKRLSNNELLKDSENIINNLIVEDEATPPFLMELVYLKNYNDHNKNSENLVLDLVRKHPNEYTFKIFYLSKLLNEGRLDEGENFYKSISETFSGDEKVSTKFNLMKMLLHFNKSIKYFNDYESFNKEWVQINKSYETLNICEILSWNNYVTKKMKLFPDSEFKKWVYHKIARQLYLSIKEGKNGKHLHDYYGFALDKLGAHREAVEEFKIAARHPNSNDYNIYINISYAHLGLAYQVAKEGNIGYSMHNFKEAEIAAKKSIKIKKTEPAIANFLTSIIGQKNYSRYSIEYSVYKDFLSENTYVSNSLNAYEGVAQCQVGNHTVAKAIYDRIIKNKNANIEIIKELHSCIAGNINTIKS